MIKYCLDALRARIREGIRRRSVEFNVGRIEIDVVFHREVKLDLGCSTMGSGASKAKVQRGCCDEGLPSILVNDEA